MAKKKLKEVAKKLSEVPGKSPDPPEKLSLNYNTLPSLDINSIIYDLLKAHNDVRYQEHVSPLTLNEPLNKAAQKHAEWMAANRNMSHIEILNTPKFDASNFEERLKNENYNFVAGAENVAAGQRSPSEVMLSWMNSQGHRDNILSNDYWNVGFGAAQDIYGYIYWCTVFGTRMGHIELPYYMSLPPALVVGN